MKLQLTPSFTYQLLIMLETKLIWYKHYRLFCDEVILAYDTPPYWAIELASVTYQGKAIEAVRSFIRSEQLSAGEPVGLADQYIACLYLKYERREISWASFLLEAGRYADQSEQVKEPCEYFYELLNHMEYSEFDLDVERQQREEVQLRFDKEIEEIRELYRLFMDYYRRFSE